MTIPLTDLEHGRIYLVRSRNLVVGAWNAKTTGFVGVRHKFSSTYLFEEYHYDTGAPYGTAHALESLDMVPENIPITSGLGVRCKVCDKPVESVPGERDGRQVACIYNTHVDPADRGCEGEATYCAYYKQNDALFEILQPLDAAINEVLATERAKADLAAESRRWRPQTQAEWDREQAMAAVRVWHQAEATKAQSLAGDELREAAKALRGEYVERYVAACEATPLPEETW